MLSQNSTDKYTKLYFSMSKVTLTILSILLAHLKYTSTVHRKYIFSIINLNFKLLLSKHKKYLEHT